jgi:hypothetical protein
VNISALAFHSLVRNSSFVSSTSFATLSVYSSLFSTSSSPIIWAGVENMLATVIPLPFSFSYSFLFLPIFGARFISLPTDGLSINDGGMYSTKVRC